MTEFEYFFSYNAMTAEGMSFGNFSLRLPAPITTFQHVQGVERFLRQQGHNHAIVLGYHLLRTIEPQS